MNERGLLTSFLACKIGMALAAFAFLGTILSMQASLGRLSEREDLAQLADAIAGAVEAIDSLPGEAEIHRGLPGIPQYFEVVVWGERGGEVQIIHIRVIAGNEVERVLMLTNQVDGGEFTLVVGNPSTIHLTKADTIQLELI